MDPKGKVALVTGGAIGIGFSTCKELLKNGVKVVVVCDVDSQKGEAAVKEMQSLYGEGRVVFMKTDVSDAKNLEETFKKTILTHNGLDIVVNNAGIINEKEWEKSIAVNLNPCRMNYQHHIDIYHHETCDGVYHAVHCSEPGPMEPAVALFDCAEDCNTYRYSVI